MKLKLLVATALVAWSGSASAAALVVGSGWQADTLTGSGAPTAQSPWTFTIGSTSTLSVSDDFVPGDTFTLSGGVAGITSFFAGASDVRATGPGGAAWLNPVYSKFSTVLGAGSYSFSLTGPGQGGIPAGLWVRLDEGALAGAVPEPAVWAFMLIGFGFIGGALRSAKTRQKLTVSYG